MNTGAKIREGLERNLSTCARACARAGCRLAFRVQGFPRIYVKYQKCRSRQDLNRNRCPRSPWSVTAFSRKQLLEPNVAEEVPFPHAVCCFPSVLAFSVSVFFLCSLTSSWLLTLFLLERHTYLFLNHICSNAAVSKVRSVCQDSVMTACSHFQFPEDVPSSVSGFYVS